MSNFIVLMLLFFAAIGYAGAGLSFALARSREIEVAVTDYGMRSLAVMLFCFGAVCTWVTGGLSAVLAYGGAVTWFSYIVAAHRVGVFAVEHRPVTQQPVLPRRHIA